MSPFQNKVKENIVTLHGCTVDFSMAVPQKSVCVIQQKCHIMMLFNKCFMIKNPGFDDLKLKKIYSGKIYIFLIKNCNLLIPRPPQRTPKLQEKPSALKREHPVLKNMKLLDIFLFLWVNFALLDPDPDPTTQINADPKPWFPVML